MTNKVYLIFVISFVFTISVFGQISEGGLPPSFIQSIQMRSNINNEIPNYEVIVDFDVNRLIWEDSIARENKNRTRVAQTIPVHLDIDSVGIWTTLNNARVWQQSITAKGAKAFIIGYKDFYIPEGAKLFIYNEDRSQILGGYNHNTHPKGGSFATEMIEGESITMEYVASTTSDEKPRMVLEDIGYVYDEQLLVKTTTPTTNPNGSLSCMINVNCPDGSLWQKQKRGVVLLIIRNTLGKWFYCSGSLVNNTAEDASPLVLTASHCFEDSAVPEQTIFYFNYETEDCSRSSQQVSETKTLVGATTLMQSPINKGGDGYLMRITSAVPDTWHPYYNGWDVRNIAANSGVVIHHPYGDFKKITTYVKPLTTYTYVDVDNNKSATDAHWRVYYDGRSVTQGGSSGSPIFNEDGLIVGALSGGATTCIKLSEYDLFSKLWYNWNQYALDSGNTSQKMKTYLDPLNKGVQTLQGLDPNPPVGIDDEIIEDYKELIIFPNPAEAELNINTSSLIKNLQIYDLSGRSVYKIDNYNSSTMTIPISSWQKGIYTISIQTELKKMTDKFIKK